MNNIVVLSPSTSGKSYFINKHSHKFNGTSLICNEYLSSYHNVKSGIKMRGLAPQVPMGHPLYMSWDDLYKIGLDIFYCRNKGSALIYNSISHLSYIKTNYDKLDLRVVLIDEEKHRDFFVKKWINHAYANKTLSEIISEKTNEYFFNPLMNWSYIKEERDLYKRMCKNLNIKIYNSFEESLS